MNTRLRIIAVFGISGVGKTTLIDSIARDWPSEILHLQASQLIKDAKQRDLDSEALRTASADEIGVNQDFLISEFDRRVVSAIQSTVIFDGHSVIDNDTDLVLIPTSVIRALSPTAIIFVVDSAATIAARRRSDGRRNRPERSAVKLEFMQSRALEACHGYSDALAVPLHVILPTDDKKARSLIEPNW